MRSPRPRKNNNNKSARLLIALAALLLISLTTENPLSTFIGFFDDKPGTNSAYTAEVVRVVDGDTLVVAVGDISPREEKVRLIGVDTPESAGRYKNNPQPGGIEASEYVENLLPPGTRVWLTMDVSETDKYGRALRYVWLKDPAHGDLSHQLNWLLVRNGYAAVCTMPPDVAYADYYVEAARAFQTPKRSAHLKRDE